ncbi:hypothetical protein [Kutzneria sp. CA-103260]|uniref:hypothetical protein n=1 Tax=Kutzneria sp. CA-103260 TaxID=2802641 RepID=UPI001BAC7F68|nr:hypothetical protein [Kutzneria sp. CA-103260]QUQ70804.1 hypothetical protein JJ691_85870 [Kutzneria sp. CA-103260]
MSTFERLPLIFRLLHPARAARITIESEMAQEFRGLRAATRITGRWHRRTARRVDRGMRLGYAVERQCRRAMEADSRPRRVGSQVLTAAQARRQHDRTPAVVPPVGSRLAYLLLVAEAAVLLTVFPWSAAALFVLGVGVQAGLALGLGRQLWLLRQSGERAGWQSPVLVLLVSTLLVVSSLMAVSTTPLLGAMVLAAPWIVVQQEAFARSVAGRRAAELSRVVLAADRERRRLLRAVDRKIAALGRLTARLERASERLQYLIERSYLRPQQDILLARSLAGDEYADRMPVTRALPDLTFMALAMARLELVTHEASVCREEAHGTRTLAPFMPDVPEQRRGPAAATRN